MEGKQTKSLSVAWLSGHTVKFMIQMIQIYFKTWVMFSKNVTVK